MSNLRLSDLAKKPNKWFREYGIVEYNDKLNINTLKYMAERTFNALPKKLRAYLEPDKERIIDVTAHSIMVDGEAGKWDMYQSMLARAKDEYKSSGDMTAEFIYKEFRLQEPSLYAKYNSYIYRLGYSAAKWFKENFRYSTKDYYLFAAIELPTKTKGKVYNVLQITYRFDGYNYGLVELANML